MCFDRFTGVSWNRRYQKWEAYVNVPPLKSKEHLGVFVDEEQAAQAVDQRLKEIVWHQA